MLNVVEAVLSMRTGLTKIHRKSAISNSGVEWRP
jgi:hypothetical protein